VLQTHGFFMGSESGGLAEVLKVSNDFTNRYEHNGIPANAIRRIVIVGFEGIVRRSSTRRAVRDLKIGSRKIEDQILGG